MAKLPDVSNDVSLLKRFIRAVEDLPTQPSAMVEVAQNHAEILLRRLETPVRIAVAGPSGAGKSSLVNLLLGAPLAPTGEGRVLPTLLFEHSENEKTTVGWWDRPSKETAGHVIKAALKEQPDLISIGVDSPILKTLQLIDVSGLDRPGHDKDAVLALTQLADVLIWCSTISDKLGDDQAALVKMLPKRLTKNSLVVLTHADELSREQAEAAAAEVERGNGKDFLYVSYIATPQAWAGFHGEGNDPAAMWEQSGAPDVLADLLEVAVKTRKKEVEKIQRSIARQVVPFLNDVPMPPEETAPEPVITEPVEAAAVEPTPEPVPEPVAVPAQPTPEEPVAAPVEEASAATSGGAVLFEEWVAKLADLQNQVSTEEIDNDSDFVQAAQELVSDFLDELMDVETIPDDHDWLVAEFEKANDLMILLQFESGDRTTVDAAYIVAQLTDSLSYI
ncbi:dynamin family protein [Actibacterium pelagium]|uniref:Dynamin N-terminal domain-containing protein n=1 Tax=Actibacterium pelagium TaxID=2029103 RepID=A0A917A9V2_9RHOB|nr:GTPase domain-containing protein [Actibacterium pelagium]GGE37397.1 hypothetical protein GCM10011517_01400 [Actibacterium pelagium]